MDLSTDQPETPGTASGKRHSARLGWALGLTLAFLVLEVIGAIWTGSLALLADAGHMLTDVAGLCLSLFAIWFASRPSNTYGYVRLEILAASAARAESRNLLLLRAAPILFLLGFLGGCAGWWTRELPPPVPPLRLVVAQVTLEAPITKSTQIHSFEEKPSPEFEPHLLAQLKEEIQITAQRFLTESLARQSGFIVVPFNETRRMLADLAPSGTMLTTEQVRMLGDQTDADIVVTGHIRDYGKVRWQYWLTGWGLSASAYVIAAGVATGWSPAAIGAVLAFDATTDFPVWYGGAEIFGWAFRPVRVHIDAVQMKNCPGSIWSDDQLKVWVPGKTLAEYPPEQHKKKEVQLEANLHRAMADIAETAGEQLRLQACTEDGRPEKIRGVSFSSLLDLLL